MLPLGRCLPMFAASAAVTRLSAGCQRHGVSCGRHRFYCCCCCCCCWHAFSPHPANLLLHAPPFCSTTSTWPAKPACTPCCGSTTCLWGSSRGGRTGGWAGCWRAGGRDAGGRAGMCCRVVRAFRHPFPAPAAPTPRNQWPNRSADPPRHQVHLPSANRQHLPLGVRARAWPPLLRPQLLPGDPYYVWERGGKGGGGGNPSRLGQSRSGWAAPPRVALPSRALAAAALFSTARPCVPRPLPCQEHNQDVRYAGVSEGEQEPGSGGWVGASRKQGRRGRGALPPSRLLCSPRPVEPGRWMWRSARLECGRRGNPPPVPPGPPTNSPRPPVFARAAHTLFNHYAEFGQFENRAAK